MIGDLLLKLHLLLSRRKLLFFGSFGLLLLFLGFGISRLRITESIFATLPKGKTFEEFNRLIENRNIINQIVFSVEIPPQTTSEQGAELASQLADSLKIHGKDLIKDVRATQPDAQEAVYEYTYAHFPELIDSNYYEYIANKTHPDSITKAVYAAQTQLSTPGSAFLKQFVINDPLGLTGLYFRTLNRNNNAGGISVEDGIMFSKNRDKILVLGATNFDSGNSNMNVRLFDSLEKLKTNWNHKLPKNKFSYFGTFEIAARNAIQVKSDTTRTMLIALAAIIAILIFYYRKVTIPIVVILPGAFGGIFALGVTGYIRPEVSGISLATGAVIFGILLDYAFHFFTHLRHTGSIRVAVKEVSGPLLTGSFTTVMAFSSLHFANSVVLQDFGLFASLSLFGAAAFTLIALPVILESVGFDYQKLPTESRLFRFRPLSPRFRTVLLSLTAILTLVFLYFAQFTSFDSSLENLSIQDNDLATREASLTGLDPKKEKRIYVFSTAPLATDAESTNYIVYQTLKDLKGKDQIRGFLSTGIFLVPDDLAKERTVRWRNFWTNGKSDAVMGQINVNAAQQGFNPSAFNQFDQWLLLKNKNYIRRDTLLKDLGLLNLIDSSKPKTTIISTATATPRQLPALKAELRQIPSVEVFDRGELAEELLAQVKDDFNYILIISASIVFLTLLIVYGRIELTLLSFLPMVISWIWILGIAAILGIKFNFVNVVIATFIFGLGDDFSIFVTDGLLAKYKEGKDTLHSYQSAIVLSALTTIVGTGVLFFAKHPAIHSVALISVLGILCILFVSFVVQPFLFDLFVSRRIASKKAPVTFLPFLLSIFSFTYFLSGCLFLHSKLITIVLLPVSKKRKRTMINNSLSFFAKTVIYSGPHVKKTISGKENIDFDKPVIYIANHTSFLDILLAIMVNPRIVLMVKGWVYNSPFFGPIIRYAGYVYTDDGPEANMTKLKQLVADGYSLLVFPEGTRSVDGKIGRFHKGAFHLATELGLDIQPILLHGASDVLPKGDFLIRSGALNVRFLKRIELKNIQWGVDIRERTKNISRYFKDEFAAYKYEMEDASYLRHKIFPNYVFKGPVLEWYFKVKWRLESANYMHYEKLIGDRKRILDIGCGYGYLSFFLHYKNPERVISGIDYDEEKITIAQNSYNKSDNLRFEYADVTTIDPGQNDVIFLNDVLHYLSKEKQLTLLLRLASSLADGGMLFIRDGITDQATKHKKTEMTEAFSTGIFSFNKKMEPFHFFSSDDIRWFAKQAGLTYEMVNHSESTSNVLFIIRK